MPVKILSIGAFSNGNLGDMYQADAIARLVHATNLNVTVTSASPSKRGSVYPAHNHEVAPAGALFDSHFVNSFDAVIVGGGGLLAADHRPLHNSDWVQEINIPMIALALGAAGEAATNAADFVQKCQFFSVRDEYSRDAIGDLRDDVEIVMDPILLDAVNTYPSPDRQFSKDTPKGIAWVPGRLLPKTQLQWAKVMATEYEKEDCVFSFNPATDKASGFLETFKNTEYLDEVDTYLRSIRECNFVVSERYHAAIYSLVMGIPVIGIGLRSRIVYSKISELLRRVGHPELMIVDPADMTRIKMRRLAEGVDMDLVRASLLDERQRMVEFLKKSISGVLM